MPKIIDSEKDNLLQFLSAIDTGIKDIGYDDNEKDIHFFTVHKGKDGKDYPLNLFYESEGTMKSIMLFIYARRAVLDNKSIFVDELNVKLHPLLLKFIVDLFYDETSSAQLIYTTHDTTLMDKRFFRRDQIWFTELNGEDRSTELYSLAEIKNIRKDENYGKGYISGRYGAIPMLNENLASWLKNI